MTTADWLEWRARGIGASDIAGILGISPWQSPFSVWATKVFDPGRGGEEPSNAEAMRWGTLLETAILSETERRLGISTYGEQTRCTHPTREFALCTVDAFYRDDDEDDGVVEVKTSADFTWYEVPPYYEAQVQWQLEVTGRKRAWLACLHNGRKLSLWRIEAAPDVAAKMLDIAERFWYDNVCAGVPPAVDGLEGTTEALRARYATPDPGTTIAVDELEPTLQRLREIRAEIKLLEATGAELENQIKAAMGRNETATIGGEPVVTWRARTTKRVDLDLLRTEYPDEATDCTVETTTRVFLLKKVPA
jgi:putative phage-type endonuclease